MDKEYWQDRFKCLFCGAEDSRSRLAPSKRGARGAPECPQCGTQWLIVSPAVRRCVEIRRHALIFLSVHALCGAPHASGTPCPKEFAKPNGST